MHVNEESNSGSSRGPKQECRPCPECQDMLTAIGRTVKRVLRDRGESTPKFMTISELAEYWTKLVTGEQVEDTSPDQDDEQDGEQDQGPQFGAECSCGCDDPVAQFDKDGMEESGHIQFDLPTPDPNEMPTFRNDERRATLDELLQLKLVALLEEFDSLNDRIKKSDPALTSHADLEAERESMRTQILLLRVLLGETPTEMAQNGYHSTQAESRLASFFGLSSAPKDQMVNFDRMLDGAIFALQEEIVALDTRVTRGLSTAGSRSDRSGRRKFAQQKLWRLQWLAGTRRYPFQDTDDVDTALDNSISV